MVHEVSTRTDAVVHPDSDVGRTRTRHRRLFSWLTSIMLLGVIGSAVADGVDLVDVWGVDEATVEAVGPGPTRLTVRYPTVSRPALASPFEIVVEREGGFDDDIELAIDQRYLALWDLNGMFPNPAEERSDDGRIVWTFDPPDGDTFRFMYEARIEPGAQLETRAGTVSLLDQGDSDLTVRFSTAVRP